MKQIAIVFFAVVISLSSRAQSMDSYVQEGEFGVAIGAAHYFGDLNTRASLNRPKFSAGVFFRKQFGNYVGLKVGANYARLGYSDIYSKNEFQNRRNLSFNTNLWEFAVSGDFNFFKFYPGISGFTYTPYVSLGVGVFSYDPYAYLDSTKHYLRPLGTEGQGSAAYPDRKPYGTMAVCFPVAVGFKYNVSPAINVFAEVGYRFTTTDYLDDVSTTYAPDAFVVSPNGQPSPAMLLADRSYETGPLIGLKGRQRGNSTQKDSYVMAHFGVSFNISSYRCPKP
ncbi:DUF6089 family protein [Segetibacter sp.]|jgi:hypothetical protein|uniref:type IX secretion system protein PorG n=1 Tax=Segetibacter sp. TaxID=2231182 RepID=UPI00262CFFC4|nr:DUF6089 family protein [Segetibacter sp.]MCW3079166.1 hypothetical protein [Segetibacter sp.]